MAVQPQLMPVVNIQPGMFRSPADIKTEGTICNDCLMVNCCTPFAWCQMARELKLRQRPLLLVNVPSVQINMHPPQSFSHPSHPSMPLQPMPVEVYSSAPQYSQQKQ
ncbi:unnamed protein product [Coregonus sp. 'balchen']|nr:unnamed protein product [Coregonus sp. 'balchen']